MNIREADIKCRGNGRSEIRRMTSGTMDEEHAGFNPAEKKKEKARGVGSSGVKKYLILPSYRCILRIIGIFIFNALNIFIRS